MSDQKHEYIQCDACQTEARKQHQGGVWGHVEPPEGWIHVVNRNRSKLWDLCPECAKAFTSWLLERAGIKPTEQTA